MRIDVCNPSLMTPYAHQIIGHNDRRAHPYQPLTAYVESRGLMDVVTQLTHVTVYNTSQQTHYVIMTLFSRKMDDTMITFCLSRVFDDIRVALTIDQPLTASYFPFLKLSQLYVTQDFIFFVYKMIFPNGDIGVLSNK